MYYIFDPEAAKAGGYEDSYKHWFKYLGVDLDYRFALYTQEDPAAILKENELILKSPRDGRCVVHRSYFRPVVTRPLNLRDYL